MSKFYRSVWISDIHLCSRDSRADLVHDFLSNIKCDYLYLVGDIIDVWALQKKWHWPAIYNEVIHKLLKRSRKGARVTFVPGNHDEFFRQFVGFKFGDVRIVMNVIHETADGKRLLVIHGDEFDAAVQGHRWLAHLGDWAYRHLIVINRIYNMTRAWFGKPYWSLSGAIKRRVKQAVKYLNNFEAILTDEARRRKVDGVICGHIHQPAVRQLGEILYCNTGDWIEHCTALVEHVDGRLELLWWHATVDDRSRDLEAEAAANHLAPNPGRFAPRISDPWTNRMPAPRDSESLLFPDLAPSSPPSDTPQPIALGVDN